MPALLQDARYALRMFTRDTGVSAVAVLTVALGVGASTALYGVVSAVLLRPLPYAASDRIVEVLQVSARDGGIADPRSETVVRELFELWRGSARTLDAIAAFGARSLTLSAPGDPIRLRAATLDPGIFTVFGTRPLAGRVFVRDDAQTGSDRVALIGERLWRSRFGGDPAVAGRSCTIDDAPYTIVGVLPDGFAFPDRAAEIWLPFVPVAPPPLAPGTRFVDGFRVVARVKADVPLADAEAEGTIVARQAQAALGGYTFRRDEGPLAVRLVPLQAWLVGRVRPALAVLFGAVMVVLLLGCANLAHVLLARGAARRRELGVRAAIGASRGRLVRQLLTESVLLALAGGAAGIAVAWLLERTILAIAPATIPRLDEVTLDRGVLAFALAVSGATGILVGLLPAMHGSRVDLRGTIAGGAAGETGFRLRANPSRAVLVVAEIAASLVLLVGAALLVKSFVRLITVDTGYDASHLVSVQLTLPVTRYPAEPARAAFGDRLLERAANVPGVQQAGITRSLPLGLGRSNVGFTIEGAAAPEAAARASADLRIVSPGYPGAMALGLVEGRFFSGEDRRGTPRVAVVNEAFVRRFFGGRSPLGTTIRFARLEPAEIVGVVGDVRHAALADPPVPEIYAPHLQTAAAAGPLGLVVRTAGDPRAAIAPLAAVVRELDPALPIDSALTMGDRVSASVAEPRFYLTIVGFFAALATAMAVVGAYGVIAYGVSQRRREIGVRLALGAGRRDIVRLVLGQAAWLTAAGLACGTLGAWAATRVLGRFLFEVTPTDPSAFLAAAALLGSVALLAAYIPARRAARIAAADLVR